MTDKAKIIICGGHFSPAVALIEKLIKNQKISLYYIGRKYSLEGDKSLSIEYQVIKKMHIPFLKILTGRLQRHLSIHTFFSLVKIPIGIIQSFLYLIKIKPKLIVSFGGYIALPVSVIAKIMGFPIISHEQTRIMGLTNRIISCFAHLTCLTYQDTQNVPAIAKITITGIPIRQSIINPKKDYQVVFGNRHLPLIYVTGGSTGSTSINQIIYDILPQLLNKYRLIHQTGQAGNYKDYQKLSLLRESLADNLKGNYYLLPYLDYQYVGSVIKQSDLIISRAGANTIVELIVLNKPTILIPLPWSAGNEQIANAKYWAERGPAKVLMQEELTEKKLLSSIAKLLNSFIQKKTHFRYKRDFSKNGADKLEKIITSQIFNA